MVKLTIYTEGGGNSALDSEFRQAFKEFWQKLGLSGKRPTTFPSGSRLQAYKDFKHAIERGENAILLVDSEDPILEDGHWKHLKMREGDKWDCPKGANEKDCHLMVQCMEAWLIADRDTLARFFAPGFNERKLPAASRNLEDIPKAEIYESLKQASSGNPKKGAYHKGNHSFKLLRDLDPNKVVAKSPKAKLFVDEVTARMA